MITRPTGMRLEDWADCVCLDLSPYGVLGKMQNDAWQDWGVQLFNNQALGKNVPNPYNFTDWLEWAERVCETVL